MDEPLPDSYILSETTSVVQITVPLPRYRDGLTVLRDSKFGTVETVTLTPRLSVSNGEIRLHPSEWVYGVQFENGLFDLVYEHQLAAIIFDQLAPPPETGHTHE